MAAESILLEVIHGLVHPRPKPRANAEINWNVKCIRHWEHSANGSSQGGQAHPFESTYSKVAQVLDEGSAKVTICPHRGLGGDNREVVSRNNLLPNRLRWPNKYLSVRSPNPGGIVIHVARPG